MFSISLSLSLSLSALSPSGSIAEGLPKKGELQKQYNELKTKDQLLAWGNKFIDLAECSSDFQDAFFDAWKVSKT